MDLCFEQAAVLLRLRRPVEAVTLLNSIVEQQPNNARAWFNRGVAQAEQGKYADAVGSYTAALKINPDHEPSRRNREAAERMVGTGIR